MLYEVITNADKCSLMKMLVQPFVENAIIHGINEKQDGIISVSFTIEDDFLIINYIILLNGVLFLMLMKELLQL